MRNGHGIALAVGLSLLFLALWPASAPAISSRTLIAPTGEAANDWFGYSAGTAGDVNGDGYADVIVGAHMNDAGGTDAGRAYIYFGGPGQDAVPGLTLTGAAGGDWFGRAVGTAGDVNGDGYADVIVGASYGSGGATPGHAYVYFGGPNADTVPDLILTGENAGDAFGQSVGTAGDVNGDGYADVIVGAHMCDAGGVNAGRAYVYFGGPNADAVPDLILTGANASDYFGFSVGTAGDVNGDGYADVIVGARGNDAGGTDAGSAYVYFGGPGADDSPDLTLTGAALGGAFGSSVGTAGDVNGDGFADVIVGAPQSGTEWAGQAYVFFGGPGADAVPDLTLTGTEDEAYGGSVGAAGDVNGDGYGDVIVGASYDSPHGFGVGHADVFFGGPAPDAVPDVTFVGAAPFDLFGYAVGTAGDVNGDGYADVVVGAPSNDAGGFEAGRAHVFSIYPYSVLSPNGGEQWVAGRPATVRWLGSDVADIAISTNGGLTYTTLVSGVGGAPENEWTVTAPSLATEYAKVRVAYTGRTPVRATSDASDRVFQIVAPVVPRAAASRLQRTFSGSSSVERLGFSASTAGDMNGDGFADVVIGAPGYSAGVGRTYVHFSGPPAGLPPDLVLEGNGAGSEFGHSVASAGDVNRDGYADVIVGTWHANLWGGMDGKAHIYLGGALPDALPDVTMRAQASDERFGTSVAGAGDVNGDGYDDWIVGAHRSSAGATAGGCAYIFLGSAFPDVTYDAALFGSSEFADFGWSVAGAGDVNGDGFADVIVGAPYADSSGVMTGRAYVYFGGRTLDTVPDVILQGEGGNDRFGISVAGAGDVNGDGFADVIVGADQNSATDPVAGRAYIYFGGPSMDSRPDVVLDGKGPYRSFGRSVGPAGDVNADGFDDVIVGAVGMDANGLAYVYYGSPGMDAVPDNVLTGTASPESFGCAVGTAGDTNRDGFDDVIVGGYSSSTGSPSAGRAYLYDLNRYHLLSPVGGETWNVGAMKTVSWLGPEKADLWLSTDAGKSFERIATDVGGDEQNTHPLRVPHSPGKFAMVKLTPTDGTLRGLDQSDSLFTIQTSVSLLALLAAPLPQGGASITWSTDPGPSDLQGYRLERAVGTGDWNTLVALTRETSVTDHSGGPGSRYRLFAVNGYGEELWLGETGLRPARALAAWPLPYRGGNLNVSFATYGGLGGGLGSAEVSVYDVRGRLVRHVARGDYAAGYQTAVWDGRDERGVRVAAGVYLLRAKAAGEVRTLKLAVLR